jgi:hypothetical protein
MRLNRRRKETLMGRKIVIGLLLVGAVAGFAAGFRGLAYHRGAHWARHAEFERHVADVCVEAAQRTLSKGAGAAAPPP